jgi:hypothetical protein
MIEIKLYAKLQMFLLLDDRAGDTGDPEDGWTAQARIDRVAVADGWIAIGTDAACDVDLQIEIADAAPGREALDDWDHVVEGSVEITSGRIVVMSPGEPLTSRLGVPPGWWRVRAHRSVFSGELESAHLILWPAPEAPSAVLVRYEP